MKSKRFAGCQVQLLLDKSQAAIVAITLATRDRAQQPAVAARHLSGLRGTRRWLRLDAVSEMGEQLGAQRDVCRYLREFNYIAERMTTPAPS